MRVTYTSGNLRFEFDATSGKAAFQTLAGIQELFEEPDCGLCKSKAIKCQTREHDGNNFLNLHCGACGAQLDIGQRKDGTGLWVKRMDKDNKPLPNRGWYKYQRQAASGSNRGFDERGY